MGFDNFQGTIAGTKLQLNLMDMLQRKLDDAVLEIISLQLSRNPNIKLMPDDIRASSVNKGIQWISKVSFWFCFTLKVLQGNVRQEKKLPVYVGSEAFFDKK